MFTVGLTEEFEKILLGLIVATCRLAFTGSEWITRYS